MFAGTRAWDTQGRGFGKGEQPSQFLLSCKSCLLRGDAGSSPDGGGGEPLPVNTSKQAQMVHRRWPVSSLFTPTCDSYIKSLFKREVLRKPSSLFKREILRKPSLTYVLFSTLHTAMAQSLPSAGERWSGRSRSGWCSDILGESLGLVSCRVRWFPIKGAGQRAQKSSSRNPHYFRIPGGTLRSSPSACESWGDVEFASSPGGSPGPSASSSPALPHNLSPLPFTLGL